MANIRCLDVFKYSNRHVLRLFYRQKMNASTVAIMCDVTQQPFEQNAAFLLLFEERFAWNDTAKNGSIDIDDFNSECLDFTSPRDFCFAEEDEEYYPSPCFRCSGGSSCALGLHTSNGDRKLAEQKAGAIVEGYEVYNRH